MRSRLYLGLMSGTSQDGVDAVIARIRDGRLASILGHHTSHYPTRLRQRLLELASGSGPVTLREFASLDSAVAEQFAKAALAVMERANVLPRRIAAIGSHGQTVFHDPVATRNSLQLGNPSLIAGLSGITTVADFRRADIAAGGQGAPLVPAFHQAQFGSATAARVVVNIGGIANISILPRRGRATGFDTGPGNGLIDEWIQLRRGRAYDSSGRWAATGQVHPDLLRALLGDSWFRRAPPKSTGRDRFKLAWARRRYPGIGRLKPADVQRTLTELTARTIAQAIVRHAPRTTEVLVCGGGIRNRVLLESLRNQIAPRELSSTDRHGLDPQQVEATAFAWLAMCAMEKRSGNLPAVTGAKNTVVLGGIYPAQRIPRPRKSSRSRRSY